MSSETEIQRMVVRLVGDGASFERMLSQANASAQRSVNTINRAGRQIEELQTRLGKGGIALAAAGRRISLFMSTTFGVLGYLGIKAGADFEAGFTGVRKTVNATEAEFASLREEFKQLATEIPVAVEEMLKVGEIAGQLGVQTSKIKDFTRVIAMLGVSTNLSGEEAATTLAKFSNITQMPQGQFSNLASALVALGNGSQIAGMATEELGRGSAATERDIAAMALRLAGAGTTIGMTVPQILGMATALSSVGLEAELGGTAMSRLFLEMQESVATGAENLAVFANTAGKTVEEFSGLFREDATQAVMAFIKGLKNLDPESRTIAIKQMGVEGIRLTDVLLRASNASELLERTQISAGQAFEKNTALVEEATKKFKDFWSQTTLLKNELKLLGEDAFKVIETHLRATVQYIKEVSIHFRSLDTATKLAGIALLGFAAILGPVLVLMGNLIWSTGQVIRVFKTLQASSFGLSVLQTVGTWLGNLHFSLGSLPWTRNTAQIKKTEAAQTSFKINTALLNRELQYTAVAATQAEAAIARLAVTNTGSGTSMNFMQATQAISSKPKPAYTNTSYLTATTAQYTATALAAKNAIGPLEHEITRLGNSYTVASQNIPRYNASIGTSLINLTSRLPSLSSVIKVGIEALKMFTFEIALLVGAGVYLAVRAFADWAMGVNEFNAALKETIKLNKDLIASQQHSQNLNMIKTMQIADPGERRDAFNAQLLQAKKNAEGLKSQIKNVTTELANTDTTWNSIKLIGTAGFAGNGKAGIKAMRTELEAMETQAGLAEQRVRELETTIAGLGPVEKAPGVKGPGMPNEEADKAAEAAQKTIDGVTDSLREQIDTWGMTSNEVEIWRAGVAGAGDDVIQAMFNMADAIQSAEDTKALEEFTTKLKEEAEVFGMTSSAAELYRLRKKLGSGADFAAAEALVKKNEAMEAEKKLMEEGAALNEKYLTPLQKYTKEMDTLNDMLAKKAITQQTYNAAVKEAKAELDKVKDKDVKLKFSVKGVEAVEMGSAEAMARINAFQAFKGGIETPVPKLSKSEQRDADKAAKKVASASRLAKKATKGAREQAEYELFGTRPGEKEAKERAEYQLFGKKPGEKDPVPTAGGGTAVTDTANGASEIAGYLKTLVELATNAAKDGTVKVKMPGIKV